MPKTSANAEREMDGVEKAAILLIALGPEKSAQIFKHLKEEEIEQLTLEIANTSSVSPQTKEQVLNEFYEVCLAQQYIAEGGITYAKELLEKALGEDKARDVIGKLTASLQVRPFEFIRKTDSTQLLNFIQDEHPQTIALILSYLPAAQASSVVSALPPEKQADVAKRIAMMDRTSPDVIKQVEKVLERKLASLVNQDYTIVGGVDAIVEILNSVDRGTEKHIMETLEVEEPELADEIRKKMFVFEDILSLDNRAIQRVLRDVDNHDLALALKGATEEVIGGDVKAVNMIEAKTIGNAMGTNTSVGVGVDPSMKRRVDELKNSLGKLGDNKIQLNQLLNALRKKQDSEGGLDEAKHELQMKTMRNVIMLEQEINKQKKELEELRGQIGEEKHACIKVSDAAYAGVKLTFGDQCMFLKQKYDYCQFVKEGADIKSVPI